MKKYIPYILALIAGAVFFYNLDGPKSGTPPPSNQLPAAQPIASEVKLWETKTDDQPPVSITVTPIQFGADATMWKFDVAFTTHSGSLDDDPTKVAVLVDDKGISYQPTAWEGAGPGGHHREGVLVFKAINPSPKYVELKIKDIGGIIERSFRWNL